MANHAVYDLPHHPSITASKGSVFSEPSSEVGRGVTGCAAGFFYACIDLIDDPRPAGGLGQAGLWTDWNRGAKQIDHERVYVIWMAGWSSPGSMTEYDTDSGDTR